MIVKPETVIAWHRRGFRLYWSSRSRHAPGRPLQYEELMPESQDLCLEHGSIPETLPNGAEQREDDPEHGICKL
jgi:hypothetical protein